MIFNSINFNNYLKVEEVRKPILPPISTISKKIPGKHGSRYIRNEFQEEFIEVDVRLIDKEFLLGEKVREIAGLLYTEEPKKTYFNDESDKYYMAILSSDTDFEKFLYTGKTTLLFLANDPIAYGQPITETINGSATNNGTYKTRGTITIKMTSTETFFRSNSFKHRGDFTFR